MKLVAAASAVTFQSIGEICVHLENEPTKLAYDVRLDDGPMKPQLTFFFFVLIFFVFVAVFGDFTGWLAAGIATGTNVILSCHRIIFAFRPIASDVTAC